MEMERHPLERMVDAHLFAVISREFVVHFVDEVLNLIGGVEELRRSFRGPDLVPEIHGPTSLMHAGVSTDCVPNPSHHRIHTHFCG